MQGTGQVQGTSQLVELLRSRTGRVVGLFISRNSQVQGFSKWRGPELPEWAGPGLFGSRLIQI